MRMLEPLIETIDYIEDHLLDNDVIDNALDNISVSKLHFKNIFFFLTGISLNEYVRNRRLAEARKSNRYRIQVWVSVRRWIFTSIQEMERIASFRGSKAEEVHIIPKIQFLDNCKRRKQDEMQDY